MNSIRKIAAILFFVGFVCILPAQNQSLRDRLSKKQQKEQQQDSTTLKKSVRAKMFEAEQAQNMDNTNWMREIYRFIDINKGNNAALIYPIQPEGKNMNLYTMIFKLMAQGKLTAYEYMDGRELFTDEYKVNFKDVLEKLNIPIQQDGISFSFNDYDIPSNDIIGYYIKEGWYFDNASSMLKVKTIAICPVLTLYDDYGIGANRLPQFWVPYDNIRPYAMAMPVRVSEKNNAMNHTLDDFFAMRLYEGEIYKVGNMSNKILAEEYKTPDELKVAQERIENELKQFEKHLWIATDSTAVKSNSQKLKKEKKHKRDKDKKTPGIKRGSKYSK